jgi:outer membrane protein TolC
VISVTAILLTLASVAADNQSAPDSQAATVTLEQAVKTAVRINPSYAAAKEKVNQAEAWKRKALAAFIPTWTVSASYTRYNKEYIFALPDGNSMRIITEPPYIVFDKYNTWILQPLNAYNVNTSLSVPILNMSNIARYRTVENQYKAATFTNKSFSNEFVYNVASAYYTALATRNMLSVYKNALEMAQSHMAAAKARYDNGDLNKLSYLKAEIEVETRKQELRRATNGYATAREALAVLLDRDANFEVSEDTALPGLGPDDGKEWDARALLDEAIKSRPDISASETALQVAQSSRQETKYKFIPTLQALGSVTNTNMFGLLGTDFQWYVSVVASWVLYDGGIRYADLREKASLIAEARFNIEALKASVRNQVRQVMLESDSCRASIGSARRQVDLASESYRVAKANFEQGLCTFLEVRDADTTLLSARINLVKEDLGYQLSRLKLLNTIGTIVDQFQ